MSQDTAHHILASRALVRARLQQWDTAIEDAEEVLVALLLHAQTLTSLYKSVKIQPSIVGYIAKCVSLVGKGNIHEGYRACDIAFEYFHSTHVTILLVIKVCISCARTEFPITSLFGLGCGHILGWRAR